MTINSVAPKDGVTRVRVRISGTVTRLNITDTVETRLDNLQTKYEVVKEIRQMPNEDFRIHKQLLEIYHLFQFFRNKKMKKFYRYSRYVNRVTIKFKISGSFCFYYDIRLQ